MSDAFGMIVVVPDPASPELARTLDIGGYSWKAVGPGPHAGDHQPDGGWSAAIVDASVDTESAWTFLRALRKGSLNEKIHV